MIAGMTVEEMRKRKRETEIIILGALNLFSNETGLEVYDIDLTTSWQLSHPPIPHVTGVSLDVRVKDTFR